MQTGMGDREDTCHLHGEIKEGANSNFFVLRKHHLDQQKLAEKTLSISKCSC